MSIKELLEKIFGGIAKLFTAKNGVRNFIYLIIALFIGNAILDFVDVVNTHKINSSKQSNQTGWLCIRLFTKRRKPYSKA